MVLLSDVRVKIVGEPINIYACVLEGSKIIVTEH
jgi:hypothetical protein